MYNKIPKNLPLCANEQLERNRKLPDFSKLQSLFRSSKPLKWLFAGDSITHGCLHTKDYPRFSEIFEFYLGAAPPRRKDLVFNTGVSGATTEECLSYENEWLYSLKADVVFICFGMNDANREEVTLEMYKNNLLHFIKSLREQGALPILQTPQLSARRKLTDEYNDAVRKIAEEEKVLLVDLDEYWKNHRKVVRGMMNDPIHPNRYGHLQWTRLLIKALGLPEVSEVLTVPYERLKGKINPFSETGKKIFSEPKVLELLRENRVTSWLIIGDFDTDCSFPKRTVPEHFEEILRFKMAKENERTSLMRFCFHLDTSRISCGEILDKFEFYVGSEAWDIVIFYPFEDVRKNELKDRIVKEFPLTVEAELN